jgi:hypothetical protein
MATVEDVESYLIRAGVDYEEIEGGTWVIGGEEAHSADIVIRVEEPIVVFRMKIAAIPKTGMEGLLRKLLSLNAHEMLHAAFGLEDDMVVIGGAQQLENLDFNEFQAMLDDIYLAVNTHYETIRVAVEAEGGQRG